MASFSKRAHSASNSGRGIFSRIALGTLIICSVIGGSIWALAFTLNSIHGAARNLSDARVNLVTPLPVRLADATDRRAERIVKVPKFSRLAKPSQIEIERSKLTVAAIRMSHQRGVAARLALADAKKKSENAMLVAATQRAKRTRDQEKTLGATSALVTALVEDVSVQDTKPFDLVLAKPETDELVTLPAEIPLPEARPVIDTAAVDRKANDEKPLAIRKPNAGDVAYAKPERSLFGGLLNRKTSDSAWLGKNAKVAIYDVSNATVYMPDGTQLRAHSGIGRMRDNPRYEHVKMSGPTPGGIYRLKMREKRFYGVEAIRMTSIDGRDPKNRTGLLTHTNLLRGQKGSHGCVAFQNYQPFLRAFKRGEVNMLVVVPELPSSRTQLAALYRKAGA